MGQRVADPRQQVRVARSQDVDRGGRPERPRVGEQLTGGLAAEELRPAQVQVGDPLERAEVEVVQRERAVGPDAVPGRPVAVGSHRDHRRRGLLVGLAHQPADVDALARQQREQRVARSGPRRRRRTTTPRRPAGPGSPPCRRRCRPATSGSSRPARRPSRPAPTRRRSRACRARVRRRWRSSCVLLAQQRVIRSCVPWPRAPRPSARRRSAPAASPSALARWWRAASHSRSSACSTALSSDAPIATEPWLPIRAACRSTSAARTAAASSGVPKVA